MNPPCSDIAGEQVWKLLGTVGVDSAEIAVCDPNMPMSNSVRLLPSGLGDGVYEVYGRDVEVEPGDTRVAELRVILINQEDIDRWAEM